MQALVIIDMQRWMFRLPERMAQVPRLVSAIDRVVSEFEAADRPIYEVRTVHKTDRSTWSRLMLAYDYSCLIEGTPDIDPVDGYRPPRAATTIVKTANSTFVNTDFEQRLRDAGVDHLVLAGVFIDGCVGLTAADAAQRGFEVTFIDDGIGHTAEDLRAPLFRWLIDDYEITSTTSVAFE